MEGFLNLKFPVWKRVLLTRSIAITPALAISFLGPAYLAKLNNWLNILQSVQLPFALVPLVKFAHDQNVIREFAIGKTQYYVATGFGIALFISNLLSCSMAAFFHGGSILSLDSLLSLTSVSLPWLCKKQQNLSNCCLKNN